MSIRTDRAEPETDPMREVRRLIPENERIELRMELVPVHRLRPKLQFYHLEPLAHHTGLDESDRLDLKLLNLR